MAVFRKEMRLSKMIVEIVNVMVKTAVFKYWLITY